MALNTFTDKTPLRQHESHARQQGTVFGKEVSELLKNWEGPATIATIAGYIASKNNVPIGNTQLTVGLGMVAAGAVAEAVSLKSQHPEIDANHLGRKMTKEWLKRLQGPSNVSLVVGIIGMLKKIKGSEAAFIAGAIGSVLNIAPIINDSIEHHPTDEYIVR